MKRPTHLEMAGWGLLTLLGAWILVFKSELGSGVPAFLLGLAVASWRVSNDIGVAFRALLLLIGIAIFSILLSATIFVVDNRLSLPSTAMVLPGIIGRANPCPGDARMTLYVACLWFSLGCGMAVRFALNRTQLAVATLRAVLVFAVAMAVHLLVASDWFVWEPKNAHYPKMLNGAIVNVYSLMPVYAGYFVALFWDVVRAKNAGD